MNATAGTLRPTVIARHDSPVGELEIHARAARITRLDIAPGPVDATTATATATAAEKPTGRERSWPESATVRGPDPDVVDDDSGGAVAPEIDLLDEARRQLDDYFARRRFGFDLPLDALGTSFQEEVWGALARVPWGTATSYGALAADLRRPLGARAVGGAIRANPIALLVPCHRVLGAGSQLTGYTPGEGVPTKRWLLDHEGIDYVG